MFSSHEIRGWLRARVAARLQRSPEAVDVDLTFDRFDFNSLAAVELAGELEEWLAMPISPLVFYEHPTIAQLAEHLAQAQASEVSLKAG
jgi:acyl carrier protein